MSIRRSWLAPLALTLSLLSLTACASAADSPQSDSPPTRTPTAQETTSPAPDEPEPIDPVGVRQAFDGRCDTILTDDEVGRLVGTAVEESKSVGAPTPFTESPRGIGGLACRWWPADEELSGSLVLTALPAHSIAADAEAQAIMADGFSQLNECGAEVWESSCYFNLLTDGYWFHGAMLFSPEVSAETAEANINTTLSRISAVTAEAGDAAALVSPAARAGAWVKPIGCAGLVQAVDAAALLGIADLQPIDGGTGEGGEAPIGYVAARAAAHQSGCAWIVPAGANTSSPLVTVDALPGGSWIQDEIAALPGAQELSGVGIERAILVTDPEQDASRAVTLHVFDGANWLSVRGADTIIDASVLPFAAAVIEAVNAAG
ncbi:hypothetical protein B0I08_103125 [Glaciihabitans tibetensis]|uniref:DUF3558 domain-containing protein n=1 Tax=Glaciihabitans tibetensis TaxID=1266600 RepID=A0A2T0VFD5_9MICO|nr:hypothetical protein [Glaciihabitans tibetensis]PRY68920.1 hypothetical protein B0I08_103125 [Glaciihabitans tibetensis]